MNSKCLILGYFEYVDGSMGEAGQSALLMSPFLSATVETCLVFYYAMFVSFHHQLLTFS